MKIKLRSVNIEDWKFILKIRNLDSVRIACHDTSKISTENHVEYMKKLDADKNSFQWIVVYDNEDVGHVKIENEEFGYMIKEGFRGKGIGSEIYKNIFEKAKYIGLRKLKVIIKIDMPIPLAVALKMGFVKINTIKKDGKPYAYNLIKKLE